MRNYFITTAIVVSAMTGTPVDSQAQSEIDVLRQQIEQQKILLEQQQRQLKAMEQRLNAMEAKSEEKDTADPDQKTVAKAPDAKEPEEKSKSLADYMDLYGSLRVRTGVDSDGVIEIDDNTSRIGLAGELPFANDRYSAFARFEVGIRMVSSPNQFEFSADPGGGVGQDDDTITSRLGYAGVHAPFGRFSWGKQNSTYYDVGGWTTDQSFVFGGEASGVYNNGTDGGPSGTGRADNAAQYRIGFGPTRLGLQVQHRNIPDNPNSLDYLDTVGGSLVYQAKNGLSAGVAYQEVRDGYEDPPPGEPASGDKATIFGLRYQTDKMYLAGVYSVADQHETDDLGNFFDGEGIELYGNYLVGGSIKVEGGWVYLDPDPGQAGDYRLNYGYAGVGYLFGQRRKGAVWLEYRLDDSTANDGSDLRSNLLSAGVTFDF